MEARVADDRPHDHFYKLILLIGSLEINLGILYQILKPNPNQANYLFIPDNNIGDIKEIKEKNLSDAILAAIGKI